MSSNSSIALSDTAIAHIDQSVFKSAIPFPHLVVDDFLPTSLAYGIYEETRSHLDFTKSNDYIFAKNKYESNDLGVLGKHCSALKSFLLSDEFRQFISAMYEHEIFVDPQFAGGGLHRGGKGSFLDMHADFNLHPAEKLWLRELNILYYLNPDWQKEYGGELELWNHQTGERQSISPIFNRLVIMLTKDHTLHGYKPIRFPDGQFRTSIAAYAYSHLSAKTDLRTTTKWVLENDQSLVKRVIAKLTPTAVMIKQAIFGSNTGKK
jgi:Rps23 Pro-64 3,4-dihydroxylase Tpa1-like proline 4-hydroxylase